MSNLIEQMQQHSSVRKFLDEPLAADVKEQLLLAAQSGSSSNFVQAFSIIEVADDQKKKVLGQLSNCPDYVIHSGVFYVFIADLYRQQQILSNQNKDLASIQSMESLLVSVVDTTIGAQNMVVAAESLGLGICYIGGIRNDLAKVAQLLNLPKYTLPLFGLTIGYPAVVNQPKPRLPLTNRFSVDSYPRDQFSDLADYDQTTRDYYANRQTNQQQIDWTQKNLDFFSTVRRPDVMEFLHSQGLAIR